MSDQEALLRELVRKEVGNREWYDTGEESRVLYEDLSDSIYIGFPGEEERRILLPRHTVAGTVEERCQRIATYYDKSGSVLREALKTIGDYSRNKLKGIGGVTGELRRKLEMNITEGIECAHCGDKHCDHLNTTYLQFLCICELREKFRGMRNKLQKDLPSVPYMEYCVSRLGWFDLLYKLSGFFYLNVGMLYIKITAESVTIAPYDMPELAKTFPISSFSRSPYKIGFQALAIGADGNRLQGVV